jgi:predicted phosphodiesterase
MEKVLIISDTHSYLDPRLMEHVEWCDQIWHGGDWGDVAVSIHCRHKTNFWGVW